MMPLKDMAGQIFGRWTVHSYAGAHYWRCRCACGAWHDILGGNLRSGRSTGCAACHPAKTKGRFIHGETGTRLYNIWRTLKVKSIPATIAGQSYEVWRDWHESFAQFSAWAHKSGYDPEMSLRRFDTTRPYSPENCFWARKGAVNFNSGGCVFRQELTA